MLLNKSVNIEKTLTTYVRAVGGSAGIKVYFGNQCCTDGKKVILPRLPMSMTPDDAVMTLALALHEAGHILFSDFEFTKLFNERLVGMKLNQFGWFSGSKQTMFRLSKGAGVVYSIWNAIEDNFMELNVESAFSGAKSLFLKGDGILTKKGMVKTGENKADLLSMHCYHLGLNSRGRDTDSDLKKLEDKLINFYGKGIVSVIADARTLMHSRKDSLLCSEDCGRLAVDYYLLFDEYDQAQDQSEDDSDEKSEDDSDEKSEDDSDEKSKDDSDEKSEDDSDEKSDVLTGTPSKGEVYDYAKAVEAFHDSIVTGENADYDISELIPCTDLTRNPDMDKDEDDPYSVWKFESESGSNDSTKDLLSYQDIISRMPVSASKVKRELVKALSDRSNDKKIISKKGKFKGVKGYRVKTGDTKVFEKKVVNSRGSASVSMLIDLSGSMASEIDGLQTIEIAIQTAAILEQGLTSIRTPFAIHGFGDKDRHVLTTVKRFGESSKVAQQRLGGLTSHFGGSTPLHSALYLTLAELEKQKAGRKVQFILTDGSPDNSIGCSEVIDNFASQGVETVIFVLGNYTPTWITTTNCKTLQVTNPMDLYSLASSIALGVVNN